MYDIVLLIIISNSLDYSRLQKTKKTIQRTVPHTDKKKKIWVGYQIFRYIRKIKKPILICAVDRML
jgi:hypothetical protein